MTKTLRITSIGNLTAATTYYFNGVGPFNAQTSANELFAKSKCRPSNGTYSKLTVRTTSSTYSTGSSTFKLRKNGADGNQSVSVSFSSSGTFTDSTNTDSFTAGDDISLSVVTGGTGAETQIFRFVTLEFDSSSNTVTQIGGSGSINFSTASATRYLMFTGLLNNNITFEGHGQIPFRSSITAKNYQARITANARTTTTTFVTRKNAVVQNMTFSVGSTATGLFEDTTNTDSIVSGDAYNGRLVTGTGNQTLTITGLYVQLENTNNVSHITTGHNPTTINFGTTYYPIFSGSTTSNTTESVSQLPLTLSGTLKNMAIGIHTNSVNGTSTYKIRINGSDSTLTTSINASSTGVFFDTTHTNAVVATDLINPSLVTGGTSGTMLTRCASLELDTTQVQNYDRPISETSVSVSETLSRVPIYVRSISENAITVSETLERVPLYIKPISEPSVSVSETLTRIQYLIKTLSDPSITVSETLARIATYLKPISNESSVSVSETLERIPKYVKSISDTAITSNETLTRLPLYIRPISETAITTNDSIARWISISYTLSEPSISVSDSIQGALFYLRSISDNAINTDDSIARLLSAVRTISDPSISNVEDTITRIQYLIKQISETEISVNDSLLTYLIFIAELVESRIKWYYSLLTRKIT